MEDNQEITNNEIIDNGEVDEVTRAAQLEAAKAANKPMIDHLPDAVEKDEMGYLVLLAAPGEKLIVERLASVLSHKPWLDTKTYTVKSVDVASGFVSLWDDDLRRDATTNYIQGLNAGYRFKLVTKKGMQIGHKKRGRPKKNPTGMPEETKPVVLGPDGQPAKKKRGRPPGVKNKNTIAMEAKKEIGQYE
jgi:hypothetical protein